MIVYIVHFMCEDVPYKHLTNENKLAVEGGKLCLNLNNFWIIILRLYFKKF